MYGPEPVISLISSDSWSQLVGRSGGIEAGELGCFVLNVVGDGCALVVVVCLEFLMARAGKA